MSEKAARRPWRWSKCYELTQWYEGDDVVGGGYETRTHWALVNEDSEAKDKVIDARLVLFDSSTEDLVADSPDAELMLRAVNAWDDRAALRARIAELPCDHYAVSAANLRCVECGAFMPFEADPC